MKFSIYISNRSVCEKCNEVKRLYESKVSNISLSRYISDLICADITGEEKKMTRSEVIKLIQEYLPYNKPKDNKAGNVHLFSEDDDNAISEIQKILGMD